jgi:protein-L-isoaspartate(D-aspartate) O-methyltransferase
MRLKKVFFRKRNFIYVAALIFFAVFVSLYGSGKDEPETVKKEEKQVVAESGKMIYAERRRNMVNSQIIARGISDGKVIDAMMDVPREEFVLAEMKEYAHLDRPLPIAAGQTISQPYIVAIMTELLEPDKKNRVLEIGAGSGYQAAVLGHIVKEVYTIEIIEELANVAKTNLEKTGYKNVFVKHGDGYKGWSEKAPFDAVIITAAVKQIPQPLIDQLKEGGKIILPKGDPRSYQYLVLGIKKDGKIEEKSVTPVRFVPMTGEALSK